MELVIDVVLLNKLLVTDALGSLNELFGEPVWVISPSAVRLLKKGKYEIAENFRQHRIVGKKLHYKEQEFVAKRRKRYSVLSKEEIESLALAKYRNLLYFVEDEPAKQACKDEGVRFMSLPMLLKALWAKKIMTKKRVWEIMDRMEKSFGMKFGKADAILGE